MSSKISLAIFIINFALILLSNAEYEIKIKVENITAQECPNISPGDKAFDNITMSITPRYTVQGVDELNVIGTDGKTQHITFPGCYNVKLKMRMLRPVERPYAEMFMQMGREIPCRRPDNRTIKDDVCRNQSRPLPEWCPRSSNAKLRRLAAERETCHSCDLCSNVRNAVSKSNGRKKLFAVQTGELRDDCSVVNRFEPYTMNLEMCTPSKEELKKDDKDNKLAEYWEFLQHGALTIVVHLLERRPMSPYDVRDCDNLCNAYNRQHDLSNAYKRLMLNRLRQICSPKEDIYVSCIYSTVRFSVSSNFK